MIGCYLCNTAAATASWVSVDLDEFLQRTASGNWFHRAGRVWAKTTACTMLAQDSRYVRNSFHGKEAAVPLHRRACTSPYAFLHRVSMHSQGLLSTMHVKMRTLDRCCEHQRTLLLHARYRICIYTRYREREIYMCIYTYIYVYVYAYVYVYVSMYICMCTCIYMCIHV